MRDNRKQKSSVMSLIQRYAHENTLLYDTLKRIVECIPNLNEDITGLDVEELLDLTQVKCSAYHDTTQSITSGVWTACNLNTEHYDTNTMHSTSTNNNRIYIPAKQGGYYLILGHAIFAGNVTGTRYLSIMKNADTTGWQRITDVAGQNPTATFHGVNVQDIIALNAGDFVGLAVFQDSGGALNIGVAASPHYATRLTVAKIF